MNRLLYLLLMLFSSCPLYAQHLQLTDTRFYCNGHEETFGDIYDVIQTRDGGFAFVGNTIDSGGGILPYCTTRFRHGVMGKLDSNGNILWINSMCNTGLFPKTICETPDGGFAINGGVPSTSPIGMLIFRYDSQGNLLWEKNYGRNAHAGTSQIITTPDNGFLMFGYSLGIDSDITVNYHLPPSTFQPADWVLMKLDSLGNKQWVKTLGTSGDEAYSAAILTDGWYYYLAGQTISKDHDCADTVNYPGPGSATYIIKLDNIGNILWSRACRGGIINKMMYDDRDNTIMIVGRSGGNGSTLTGGYGYDDMYLMKLDTAAKFKWGKLYGTGYNDEGLGLCKGQNHGYLVAGWGYGTPPIAYGELVNVDSSGKVSEQKIVTGSDVGGLAYRNIFPSQGGYAALGITSTKKFNEGTGVNCRYDTLGSGALMLSRFQVWKTGVTTLKPATVFALAPNPAHNSFRVSWDKAHGSGVLTCTNNTGQIIYRQKVEGGVASLEISSSAWPRGSYTMCWQTGNEAAACKTIIIN